jgi:hypothetical protein
MLFAWAASHDDVGGNREGNPAPGVNLVGAGGPSVLDGDEADVGRLLDVVEYSADQQVTISQ